MKYKRLYEKLLHTQLPEKTQVLTLCPFHKDKNPSLSINLETGLFHCFGCGEKGNIHQFAERMGYQIKGDSIIPLDEKDVYENEQKERPVIESYSIKNYCREKKLDKNILQQVFKITDDNNYICIPYYDENNNLLYNKYRGAQKKFRSDKNIQLSPYGLWLVKKYDFQIPLYIVEGESDTHTFYQLGYQVVGFPGANTVQTSFFESITNFSTYYLTVEPDNGGITFLTNVYRVLYDYYPEILDSFYVIFPSDLRKKDINEIWYSSKDISVFKHRIHLLTSMSIPLETAYRYYVEKEKLLDVSIRPLAISIFKKNILLKKDNQLWHYNPYKKEYEFIKNEGQYLDNLLTEEGITSISKKNALRSQILVYAHKTTAEDISADWVHFKNISVNYKTFEQQKFDSTYFITNRLPFDYNPNAQSFVVEKLFRDWVENPLWLFELIGYTFIKSYPKNKFFFLYGRGGNGKSTFLEILETILGSYNTAHVDLNDLVNDRFASARLYQRHACIAGEISYTRLTDTKQLKDITGQTIIDAQFKFSQPFSFRNFAKLIFATNKIPSTTDTTEGFMRRVVIIEFKEIPPKKQNPLILENLQQNDYEYIIYKSMQALHNLYKNGFIFTVESVKNMRTLYQTLSNPLIGFIEDNFIKNEEGEVLVKEVFNAFNKFARQIGYPVFSYSEFLQEMQELGYEKVRKRTFSGARVNVFTGLEFKTQAYSVTNETDEVPF